MKWFAQPPQVFSEPIVGEKYTIVLASEVAGGGGFGSSRSRGGRGGGGGSWGRPVAVIVIGPEGVEVEPIVDVTKILTGLVAWGILWTLLRAWRGGPAGTFVL